jgi:hypothetical protein
MARQRQDENPADFCRRMGWGAGTIIRKADGSGRCRIYQIQDKGELFDGDVLVIPEAPEYRQFSLDEWEIAP